MSYLLSPLLNYYNNESDLSKICNACGLINAIISRNNWCGFYLLKNDKLTILII